MKPDRSNYEIWLIDRLDGKLNEIQDRELLSFLEENPDLKEEFYFYSDIKLDPLSEKFLHKKLLKKNPSDITDTQFEYLCAGYVENDLSAEQLEELETIVSDDITRKQELYLFKQTRLSAPDIRFNNKHKLLRITPFQKALSISVAAAASIAIFIVASLFIGKKDLTVNNLSEVSVTPNIIVLETVLDSTEIMDVPTEKIVELIIPVAPKEIEKDAQDSIYITFQRNHLEPVEIPDLLSINFSGAKDYQSNVLLSLKTDFDVFDASDSEFRVPVINLAQIFRKKILKDETPDFSPLKGYELAEAGIIGLNRLLGWEMDFRKKSDENGKVKTVYFSSRLLEAQIPVHKSE